MRWQGERVRLRAIEPEDAAAFGAADDDTPAAALGWRVFPPRSAWAVDQWVVEQTQQANDSDEFRLAIEADGEVVGSINTHTCDPIAGTFSYGVGVFEWQRQRGYASDAISIVLRYMFGERRYQKCTITTLDTNEPSIALHKTLGFEIEGRIRRAVFTGGAHHDQIVMGLTAEEHHQTDCDPRDDE